MDFLGKLDVTAVQALAGELQRRRLAARDYIVSTKSIKAASGGRLVMQAFEQTFRVGRRDFTEWGAAEKYLESVQKGVILDIEAQRIEVVKNSPQMTLSSTARSQLLTRLEVPIRFANKLRDRKCENVVDYTITTLLERTPEQRVMIRTMDGEVRAVLSDSYRIIDSQALFFASLGLFRKKDAELWDARLSDDGFFMFGVRPGIVDEVTLDRTFDPGDGWMSRWHGKEGDSHNPAVGLGNSDTGRGGLVVNLAVLRKICANFCIWGNLMMTRHVGSKIDVGDELLISERTRMKMGELKLSEVEDAIDTAFDETKFAELIARMNQVTQVKVENPKRAVQAAAGQFGLTAEMEQEVYDSYIRSLDNSQFGLAQAITDSAKKAPAGLGAEMQKFGADVLKVERLDTWIDKGLAKYSSKDKYVEEDMLVA